MFIPAVSKEGAVKMNKNILIFHPGGLGDFLMFSPALKILLENGYFCEIITLDRGSHEFISRFYTEIGVLARFYPNLIELFGAISFITKNISKKYYAIFSTTPFNSIKALFFYKLLRAENKIIRLAKNINSVKIFLSNNDFLHIANFEEHLVFENLKLLKYIKLDNKIDKSVNYFFSHREKFRKNPSGDILISPGSSKGQAYKRYPINLWKKVIEFFIQMKLKVGVLLGPAESELKDIFDIFDFYDLKVYYSTDFDKTLNIISNYKILLHNDNGVGHLAAALNLEYLKIVSIFGPENPNRSAPFSNNCFIIKPHVKLDCMPCIRPGGNHGCSENVCLNSIPPEVVVDTVVKILNISYS